MDIEHILNQAWQRIRPQLLKNPTELARRLKRRNSQLLLSPPRPWCLAIRAADKRLDEFSIQHLHGSHPHPSDQILLTQNELHLFAPVHIDPPGEPLADVAAKLGCSLNCLRTARLNNLFHHRHTDLLDGHAGKPHPLLYTPLPLDPSARGFLLPDPAFSLTAAHLRLHLPKKFLHTLTRVAHYREKHPRLYKDLDSLHPEHPDADTTWKPDKRRGKHLPTPAPDYVPYKWKDGQYLGYDWRNPLAEKNYQRHQRALKKARAAAKRRRAERGPALSQSKGSLQFLGYKWLCPTCQRKVEVLFYPLKRWHLLPKNIRTLLKLVPSVASSLRRSVASPKFQCEKCTRIRRNSPADPNYWNEIVTYLSAGLLYGREVPRPTEIPRASRADRALDPSQLQPPCPERAQRVEGPCPERATRVEGPLPEPGNRKSQIRNRKLAYVPRPNRSPSQRRPQIEKLLLSGKSFKQIASELHLVYGTVLWHAQQIYKQHHVRTLPDLLKKHGHPIAPPPTKEVRARLLHGQSIAQIDYELRCGKTMIYNQRQQLRKEGIKLPDARDNNRVGGKRSDVQIEVVAT